MPINITRGNSAQFGVQFVSSAGAVLSPSSAWVSLVYQISGVANSSNVDLALVAGRWTATWSSVGVDLGLVNYSVNSAATSNPAQVGQLRIIDP